MSDTQYIPRLKAVYRADIRKAMQEQFSYANEMMVPRLEKIVIDRKSARLNSSHITRSRMPSSA